MIYKILVPLLFVCAQFFIAWYGNFTGKLSEKGSFLGFEYSSEFASIVIIQIKFVWLLILINILFSLGFQWGFDHYKNFLVIALLWVASGPIAAVLFYVCILKGKIDVAMIIGIVLIAAGSLAVIAHKEIQALF